MTRQKYPTIICIEGNIGCGKTTMLDALEYYYRNNADVCILREPVEEWSLVKDRKGDTILTKFYRDPAKYAFAFQMLVFQTIQKAFMNVVVGVGAAEEAREQMPKVILCERSVLSSRFIFERMLYESGHIDEMEHQIYERWFEDDNVQCIFPDKVVYLDCPPETCMERIAMRDRKGEDKITLEYLMRCEAFYRKNLRRLVKEGCGDEIVKIDVSDGEESMDNLVERVVEMIYY